MPLLGRNPFHLIHSTTTSASSSERSSAVLPHTPSPSTTISTTTAVTGTTGKDAAAHGHSILGPPPLRRSSRSFLNFMSKKMSVDSLKSEKSLESIPASANAHHNHHHHHHQAGNNTNPFTAESDRSTPVDVPITPKPSHSMIELKRFLRPVKKSAAAVAAAATATGRGNHTQQQQQQQAPHGSVRSPVGRHGASTVTNTTTSSRTAPDKDTLKGHHPFSTTQLNLNSMYQDLDRHNNNNHHAQSGIPPTADSALSLSNTINIYHDDTILAQKYGRLGKTLGSGAGGSVKILTRPSDGVTFAVKEFRPRKQDESVNSYAKKCTAEFCIGSSLHHPNIVETIDIFSDFNQFKYFEVMEYLPIDFFAVVMTGLMSRGEINCCIKQICEGVKYLHSMGLAHRDLKLDNCCMTETGILKIIDFGSAVVFKYPFDDKKTIHPAHGIVGSDPYLAPEVLTSTKRYDPQLVDVWSIGIIYCCMMLKRFPWKVPKMSDDNFKLYCMPDDTEHDYVQSAKHHEELLRERKERRHQQLRDAQQQPLSHPSPAAAAVEEAKQTGVNDDNSIKLKEDEIDAILNGGLAETQNQTNTKTQAQAPAAATAAGETEDVEVFHDTRETQDPDTLDKKEIASESSSLPSSDRQQQQQQQQSQQKNKEKEKEINNSNIIPSTKEVGPSSSQKSSSHSHHSSSTDHTSTGKKKVIHGPYRLLRLLPHVSRPILSRMLMVDPAKRVTLDEIFEDEWFASIPACTMDAKKNVIRAHGHHHTIVKGDKPYKI